MKLLSKTLFLILALLMLAPVVSAQETVGLNFNNAVGTPHANDAYGLGSYFSSSTVNFLGVATVNGTVVDMRVTAAAFGTYQLYGHYADYDLAAGQPDGDIGVLYRATSYGSGGLDYTLEFFESGSNFTTRYTLDSLSLLIYDVDGEANQTESFRAYTANALLSYELANSPNSVTATNFFGGVNFTGRGSDVDETDRSGAVVLNYGATDTVHIRFESTTTSGPLPNGVFSAIDGDMSMAMNVPEPSSAILVLLGGMFAVTFRRRPASKK